jgi:hypothetical protein
MPPKATHIKKRRKLLRYDLDLNRQVLFRVDIIVCDPKNDIITPITPLYEARLENWEKSEAAIERKFNPRELNCCFAPNEVEIRRTVYLPYLPTMAEHKRQIQETLNYPNVLSANYRGESHDRELESYL